MRNNYEKPTPLKSGMAIPSKDAFLAWCEDETTQFVASAYSIAAKLQKEYWIQVSWEQGKLDEKEFLTSKVREQTYREFLESVYEDHLATIEKGN